MTETSAGKINKEEHIFKSTSGVCDIHTVIHGGYTYGRY